MRTVTVKDVPHGAQFIDVREQSEYSEVHAQGTVNLPMSEFTYHTNKLDKTQPVYVICKGGGRSAQIVEYLTELGFEALNVEGGTTAWVDAHLPTSSDNA